MNTTQIYLHPTPVRIWHWLNAFGILTLGICGARSVFPNIVNLFGSYRAAIELHNTAGILVSISFALWFFYYTRRPQDDPALRTHDEDLRHGLVRQAIFYFYHLLPGRPNPHHPTPDNKFNPLQKSAYLAIMFVLVPLVSLTGILLMNVAPMRELVLLVGG